MKTIDLKWWYLNHTPHLVITELVLSGVPLPLTILDILPIMINQGKLFYILDKSAPTSDKHYKVALNKTYKGPGSGTFYDAEDDLLFQTQKNIR